MTSSAEQLCLIHFETNDATQDFVKDLVIKDGLLVPSEYVVKKGIVPFRHWPKNETSLPLLKQMLGAKKKKVVQEEEEKEEIPIVEDQEESENSDDSSESEEVEDEDD